MQTRHGLETIRTSLPALSIRLRTSREQAFLDIPLRDVMRRGEHNSAGALREAAFQIMFAQLRDSPAFCRHPFEADRHRLGIAVPAVMLASVLDIDIARRPLLGAGGRRFLWFRSGSRLHGCDPSDCGTKASTLPTAGYPFLAAPITRLSTIFRMEVSHGYLS